MSQLEQFQQRLDAAFADAKTRIHEFQEEAGREYEELNRRYQTFDRLVKHIGPNIARPRLEKLAEYFPGVDGIPSVTRHGREILLNFQKTPTALATIRLRLRMTHDEEIRHLVLEYDLEILPVYIEFERTSRLEIPLEEATDQKVAAWLDERLMAFVSTYLSMEFSRQYQRPNMVIDPVAEIQFPKLFATGTCERAGQTYHFISKETQQAFQAQPELYLAGHKQ